MDGLELRFWAITNFSLNKINHLVQNPPEMLPGAC